MRIRIKRFDKKLPLPEYKTSGAAAFDLTARERVEIPSRKIGYVPLNVACETPEGHFLLLAARSSTHKKGLMLANGVGVLDPDFSGDGDECVAVYFNFTDQPVIIGEVSEQPETGRSVMAARVLREDLVRVRVSAARPEKSL